MKVAAGESDVANLRAISRGLPRFGASVKEPACQCRKHKRCGFKSLGQEDPPEEGMAIHYSILAWRIPWSLVGYSP